MTRPAPAGLRFVVDPGTTTQPDGALVGGSPARVMRLSTAGQRAMHEITTGPVRSAPARQLARRLSDAGLLHPRPTPATTISVTVVIPVRDRAADLDSCLRALGAEHRVVVVDDESVDPHVIREIASRHGATVIRRDRNGGPGAARNTALAAIDTDLVALLDSDCTPPANWIDRLAGHFADPEVAIAAPRIVPAAVDTAARHYATACGSLDLGAKEARVVPLSPVAYVPAAALVARREALLDVDVDGNVFDETMRYGEDVDLVWRLHARGWRMRFDPSVAVAHREPATWGALMKRRFNYGTSAGALARRHPGLVAPVVIRPLPLVTVVALVTGHSRLAASGFIAGALAARRTLLSAGVDPAQPVAAAARNVAATWVGLSRYLAQFAAPAVVAVGLAPGRRRWLRRVVAVGVVLTPTIDVAIRRRPAMNPVGLAAATLADHAAYGAGVWTSAIRTRSVAALLPTIV